MKNPADMKNYVLKIVEDAVSSGCRKSIACEDIGIDIRSIQRWKGADILDDKRATAKRNPANKLTELEKRKMEKVLNSEDFKDKNPWEIVPALADRGIYIASESSFYRHMREKNLLAHRSKSKPKKHKKPEGYVATGPNQVYTWDITYLKTTIKGSFYYLYMIMDIYSRKIVGWRVHERQDENLSSLLIEETLLIEKIKKGDPLVLHSDNGGPMKGSTMLATLQKLGVVASFSRPKVSDDNPYSESLFKTLKYTPRFPSRPFISVEAATQWVSWFADWYNNERLHGEIKYVTPASRHRGEDAKILKNRKKVYELAKAANPTRWSGKIKNWTPVGAVYLNPTEDQKKNKNIAEKAA